MRKFPWHSKLGREYYQHISNSIHLLSKILSKKAGFEIVSLETEVCVHSCFSHVWLWDPMECSPPGSPGYRILHARILDWVAMSSSRVSSQTKEWTSVSCIACVAGRFFTSWAIGEAPRSRYWIPIISRNTNNQNLTKLLQAVFLQICMSIVHLANNLTRVNEFKSNYFSKAKDGN